jgi:hypothetical protein
VAEGQNNVKRQEPDGSINKPDPTTRLRQIPVNAHNTVEPGRRYSPPHWQL